MKVIFQKNSCEVGGWDERRSESDALKFRRWVEGAELAGGEIVVNRWDRLEFENGKMQVVGSCDASGRS